MGGSQLSPRNLDQFNQFAKSYINSRTQQWQTQQNIQQFSPFDSYRLISWKPVILDVPNGYFSSAKSQTSYKKIKNVDYIQVSQKDIVKRVGVNITSCLYPVSVSKKQIKFAQAQTKYIQSYQSSTGKTIQRRLDNVLVSLNLPNNSNKFFSQTLLQKKNLNLQIVDCEDKYQYTLHKLFIIYCSLFSLFKGIIIYENNDNLVIDQLSFAIYFIIIIFDPVLVTQMNKKLCVDDNQNYQSPKKNNQHSQFHQQSLIQTHQKAIRKYQQEQTSITTNKGSNRKSFGSFHRTIEYSNLKLLEQFKNNLINSRQSIMSKSTEQTKEEQKLVEQLKKTYVIYCRVNNIKTQVNKYIFQCVDETSAQMQIVYLKQFSMAQIFGELSNKKNKNGTNDIESLEYQHCQVEGHPYFQFIVNFREHPVYQKEFTFMKEKHHEQSKHNKDDASLSNVKKRNIIGYELNLHVNKFRPVQDYNLVTLCFTNIIMQKIQALGYQDVEQDQNQG